MLDFDGKFTLLIPNIEVGKAFRINKADVEVQTKDLESGHKLTFMRFSFQSPQLEIKAPVLNDKEVGYRVLSQNGACVFLKRILNIPGPGQPGAPGHVPGLGPGLPHPGPHPGHHQPPHQYQRPVTNGGPHPGHGAPMRAQYPDYQRQHGPPPHMGHPPVYPPAPPQAPAHVPGYNPMSSAMSPPMGQPCSPVRPVMAVKSRPPEPEPAAAPPAPPPAPAVVEKLSTKPGKTSDKNSKVLSNQNFFELYKALGEDDYTKMTTCPACQRKFRFTSVLIDHMASHYATNVDNIVEMKLKIWNNGSKLKCNFPGCKKKCAYTLDYTKHRDNHLYEGLSCSVCGQAQASPSAYSVHLKEEHPDHLFSTESHQDDLVPPPSAKKKEPPPVSLGRVPEVMQESPSPLAAPITNRTNTTEEQDLM